VELLRARQEEEPSFVPSFVDGDLQRSKEAGRVLHLVDRDRRRITPKEILGSVIGLLGCARKVKRHKTTDRERPS